jgi:hypothetical protein
LDKVGQVIAALHRRPLPSLLEWHAGPMPHAAAPAQRVGTMIGNAGAAMGNVVLAIRAKQGLRCLSGMIRPLDPQRLQRLGLQRTGDAVGDRMLDVAASEIEAGNASANEIGIIGDILKGIFDGASSGIQRAQAGGGQSSQFLDSAQQLIDTMRRNLGSSHITALRNLTKNLSDRPDAYNYFKVLVGNGKPWDIKH